MRRVVLASTSVVFVLWAANLAAQEKELTAGNPVRVEDAFYVAAGDGSLLATAGFERPAHGPDAGALALDLQYGLLPRTQLSLATELSTQPDDMRDPSSGDLNVAARVNEESRYIPLLAVQLAATFPTGHDSRAVDLELKSFATKSVTAGTLPLYLHLNASLDARASGRATDDRLLRFHLAAGPSLTVPWQPGMTLVADVYADQAVNRHDRTTVGIELGVRYKLSPHRAVHGGVGTEVLGPENRSAIFARVGLGFGFTGPAFGRTP